MQGLLHNHTALHDFSFSTTGATSRSYIKKVDICSSLDIFNSFCCRLINRCEMLDPAVLGTILIGDLPSDKIHIVFFRLTFAEDEKNGFHPSWFISLSPFPHINPLIIFSNCPQTN